MTDWSHAHWAPYEPDTDGTEVQVEPLVLDAAPMVFGDNTGELAPLYVADDGVDALAAWPVTFDAADDRELS